MLPVLAVKRRRGITSCRRVIVYRRDPDRCLVYFITAEFQGAEVGVYCITKLSISCGVRYDVSISFIKKKGDY